MVPPSPVQGTVGGAGLHRGKPPTGQEVAAKNRSLFSQNLREGSPRNPNTLGRSCGIA
jgi:hypothetical protein